MANKAPQTLAQRAAEAFGVVGLSLVPAAHPVGARWKRLLVGQPEVAARGPAAASGREALTQGTGALGERTSHAEGDGLASLAAKGDPHPAHVGLGWSRQSSKARPVPTRRPLRQAKAGRLAAGGPPLFFEPVRDRVAARAEDPRRRPQAQPLAGHRTQHLGAALGRRWAAFGCQHPARPARPTAKLLVAARVLAAFGDALALAACAAWCGLRCQRRCSCQRPASPMISPLSFNQEPLPGRRTNSRLEPQGVRKYRCSSPAFGPFSSRFGPANKRTPCPAR